MKRSSLSIIPIIIAILVSSCSSEALPEQQSKEEVPAQGKEEVFEQGVIEVKFDETLTEKIEADLEAGGAVDGAVRRLAGAGASAGHRGVPPGPGEPLACPDPGPGG